MQKNAPQTNSITIRGLDPKTKRKLRMRAAERGHSMEEEVRRTLDRAAREPESVPNNLAQAIAEIVAPLGGIILDLPPRSPMSEPPRFDWDDDA
jgi:antitoxin FitA